MITEKDILEAIAECQGQRNPNANTCLKLASFYTILDHLQGEDKAMVKTKEIPAYSFAERPDFGIVKYNSDSEFGRIVHGKNEDFAWEIMDELMATLQEMIPRLYNGVLNRLNQ